MLVLGDEAAEGLGGAGGLSGRGVGEGALHPGKGLVQQLLKVVRRIPAGAPAARSAIRAAQKPAAERMTERRTRARIRFSIGYLCTRSKPKLLNSSATRAENCSGLRQYSATPGDFLPGGFKAGFRFGAVFP